MKQNKEKRTSRQEKEIIRCIRLDLNTKRPRLCWHLHPLGCSSMFFHTHLDVPEGQEQVNDNIRGEQVHAVQAFLDTSQFLAQVLAAETLPRPADLLPDGLPEVLATADNRRVKTLQLGWRHLEPDVTP